MSQGRKNPSNKSVNIGPGTVQSPPHRQQNIKSAQGVCLSLSTRLFKVTLNSDIERLPTAEGAKQ